MWNKSYGITFAVACITSIPLPTAFPACWLCACCSESKKNWQCRGWVLASPSPCYISLFSLVLMANSLYEMCMQESWMFVLVNTTTTIPIRYFSWKELVICQKVEKLFIQECLLHGCICWNSPNLCQHPLTWPTLTETGKGRRSVSNVTNILGCMADTRLNRT